MAPILSVNNVHFVRNHRAILNGVTWTINPGEHWAILGANGCGKTTLLKLVTGILNPTKGNVQIFGRIVPLLSIGASFNQTLTG